MQLHNWHKIRIVRKNVLAITSIEIFLCLIIELIFINCIPSIHFSPITVHFYSSTYRKDFSACVCQDVFSHDSYFVTILQLVAAPQGETCSQT